MSDTGLGPECGVGHTDRHALYILQGSQTVNKHEYIERLYIRISSIQRTRKERL